MHPLDTQSLIDHKKELNLDLSFYFWVIFFFFFLHLLIYFSSKTDLIHWKSNLKSVSILQELESNIIEEVRTLEKNQELQIIELGSI